MRGMRPSAFFRRFSWTKFRCPATVVALAAGLALPTVQAPAPILEENETPNLRRPPSFKTTENTLYDALSSDWTHFHDTMELAFTEEIDDGINDNMKSRMERVVRATQEHLCHEIEVLENGAKFTSDLWQRDESGIASKVSGGLTKVLSDGEVFEKAGVSVSVSSGILPSRVVKQMTADHGRLTSLMKEKSLGDEDGNVHFFAASVSSVCHPRNPHGPTGHFNYRYFELGDLDPSKPEGQQFVPKAWWFGGGADLTPSILDKDDARYFHSILKSACDSHGDHLYSRFKKWCDNYFVVKHRSNERRGVGGIFFDDIDMDGDKQAAFDFVKECASKYTQAYVPIVKRHANQEFTEKEKEWQQIRRGRYVEFNLVYDRGTKFGLMKPGARIESILMSLPLTARWEYCRAPQEDFEKELYDVLIEPVDWLE